MAGVSSSYSAVPQRLVEKFSGAGPRYTSYPTAVEFHEGVGEAEWRQALADDLAEPERRVRSQGPASSAYSLYFHLPFCHTLCYFCACNKVIPQNRDVVRPYLTALIRELEQYRSILGPGKAIEQIHWGGGTPNYFTPEEMSELHQATIAAFPNLLPDAEVSVEIDPRTTSAQHISTLRALGFNRVSLGVQDFASDVQVTINRVQSFEVTRQVIDWAREAGMDGVNVDLVYGLPNQTRAGFQDSLEKVLAIRPDRVALYGYAHVTWLKKVQKALERAHLPTAAERIELLQLAIRAFSDAGYDYIGLDHFALPEDSLAQALCSGRLNRNFMGYTSHSGARIIGCGASSISSLPLAFAQNTKEIQEYQRLVNAGQLPVHRGLLRSREDCMRGDVIEALLCQGLVDIQRFEQFWQEAFGEVFHRELAQLSLFLSEGLVELDARKLRLTSLGRLFARNVAMLFDAYLAQHQQANKQVFSQAV